MFNMFEWWCERFNPGPVATVQYGRGSTSGLPGILIVLKFLILCGLAGWGVVWVALEVLPGWFKGEHYPRAVAGWVAIIMAYLGLGYIVRPQVPMDNIGWFGGLMNHPFRISDDWNRFVLLIVVLLYPGRIVAESIVDLWDLAFATITPPPPTYGDDADNPPEHDVPAVEDWEDDPFEQYLPEDHPTRRPAKSEPSTGALLGLFLAVLGISFGLAYWWLMGR